MAFQLSALTSRAGSTRKDESTYEPDSIMRKCLALYKESKYVEALELLSLAPQHYQYFNRGFEHALMRAKCLRHLGEHEQAIDTLSRYLLQESYNSPSHEGRAS